MRDRVFAWLSFVLLAGICQFAAFYVATKYGADGKWWIGFVPFLLSHLGMAIVRLVYEPNVIIASMFSRKTQSWAFLYGDAFALPAAFFGTALAWSNIPAHSGFHGLEWLVISYVVGWLIGLGWMFKLDGPNYRKIGEGDRLSSPTKIWHDLVVYSSLSGAAVFLVIPVVWPYAGGWFPYFGGWILLGLAGLAVWAVLGVKYDNERAQKGELIPENLHPRRQDTVLA